MLLWFLKTNRIWALKLSRANRHPNRSLLVMLSYLQNQGHGRNQ